MLQSALFAALAMNLCGFASQADDLNVVRSVPAQFSVPPNYPVCIDPGDPTQLTDGVLATRNVWVDPASVGWYHVPEVQITFDLGKQYPIGSIELHTGSIASVPWPRLLIALGSDDGNDWRDLGELVGDQETEAKTYETRWFRLDAGGRQMRYVRIVATTGGDSKVFFADEIRVLRADGDKASSLQSLSQHSAAVMPVFLAARGVRARIAREVQATKEIVRRDASATHRSELMGKLDAIVADARGAGVVLAQPLDRAAVLGGNGLDIRVARVRALAWRDSGLAGIVAWKAHRFAFAHPWDSPGEANPTLRIDALRGEVRSDALMLTNATDTDQSVSARVTGLDGAKATFAFVPWVDTASGVLVSSALPWGDTGTIPTGTTMRVWLRVDTSGVRPGQHTGSVELGSTSVPITLNVSKIAATKPRMSLTVSDYAVGTRAKDPRAVQLAATLALLREAYVDTVWARRSVLPWPSESSFDADNRLNAPLDFSDLDRWLADTPDKRYHLVFISGPETFAGAKQGTDAFAARVTEWAKQLQAHVPPTLAGRVGFLTVDEPHSQEQADRSLAWARALKAGAPHMVLFVDPQWEDPKDPNAVKVLEGADIVALHIGRVVGKGHAREDYRGAVIAGQETWIYGTARGGKALDPSVYFRMAPWRAFAEGATGVSIWSVSDDGHAVSSWDEYTATSPVYTPLYLGDGITDSVHWQALVEGMQDAELFTRLKAATRGTDLQADADLILSQVADMAGSVVSPPQWAVAGPPQAADDLRIRAIALLERAKG